MNAVLRPDPTVRRLYRAAPRPVRLHLALRWITCPFQTIADVVPSAGSILDVGCGHGLFATALAVASPARQVRGLDIDERKIRHAEAAAEQARRQGLDVAFTLASPGQVPPGPWDCILVVDVLYLLEPHDQERLLRVCAGELGAGGLLLVKEMAHVPKWKLAWNTLQEAISVHVLRITRGRRLIPLPPHCYRQWLATAGLSVDEQPLHRGYPYPHHLLVGRHDGGPAPTASGP